jgi:AcrR family transcriptional regulator
MPEAVANWIRERLQLLRIGDDLTWEGFEMRGLRLFTHACSCREMRIAIRNAETNRSGRANRMVSIVFFRFRWNFTPFQPLMLHSRHCECMITHMKQLPETPTASLRKAAIATAAVTAFAKKGYHATTVADVAALSGFSAAYVFRLFSDKLGLFVAAIDLCYQRIGDALADAASKAIDQSTENVIDAMGAAYADLIADRDLLMVQVHAQSAADIPEIRGAVRQGYASIIHLVRERSGADDARIQLFVAQGQLCHLIVTAGLDELDAPWALALTQGMRHPASQAGTGSMSSDEAVGLREGIRLNGT